VARRLDRIARWLIGIPATIVWVCLLGVLGFLVVACAILEPRDRGNSGRVDRR